MLLALLLLVVVCCGCWCCCCTTTTPTTTTTPPRTTWPPGACGCEIVGEVGLGVRCLVSVSLCVCVCVFVRVRVGLHNSLHGAISCSLLAFRNTCTHRHRHHAIVMATLTEKRNVRVRETETVYIKLSKTVLFHRNKCARLACSLAGRSLAASRVSVTCGLFKLYIDILRPGISAQDLLAPWRAGHLRPRVFRSLAAFSSCTLTFFGQE